MSDLRPGELRELEELREQAKALGNRVLALVNEARAAGVSPGACVWALVAALTAECSLSGSDPQEAARVFGGGVVVGFAPPGGGAKA